MQRQNHQARSSEEFNSTRQFPEWEHLACLATIPVRIYARNIEKVVE
jgi:hypothetical protein